MPTLSRRELLIGATALPLMRVESATSAIFPTQARDAAGPRLLEGPPTWVAGQESGECHQLIANLARRLFDEEWMGIAHENCGSQGSALRRIARSGRGLTCCSARAFIAACRQGVPVVSVAELSRGLGHEVIVRQGDTAVVDLDLSGRKLLALTLQQADLWRELASEYNWRRVEIVHGGAHPGKSLAAGAVDAMLASRSELAHHMARGHDFVGVDLPRERDLPAQVLAAPQHALHDRQTISAIKRILATLNAAASLTAREPRVAAAALKSDGSMSYDRGELHLRFELLAKAQSPVLGREHSIGRHERFGWRKLAKRTQTLRSTSFPVVTNRLLPRHSMRGFELALARATQAGARLPERTA